MNKTLGPHPHLVRFLWKRIPFDELGLPSTLIHWVFKKKHINLKTLLKVDQNENAYITY